MSRAEMDLSTLPEDGATIVVHSRGMVLHMLQRLRRELPDTWRRYTVRELGQNPSLPLLSGSQRIVVDRAVWSYGSARMLTALRRLMEERDHGS